MSFYLIVESIHGGHVPSVNSSIPVITHAKASFFSLRSRAHICLAYIKFSNLSSPGHEKMYTHLIH
jgi:hypothetical protein